MAQYKRYRGERNTRNIEELLDTSLIRGPCRIKGREAISSSQNFLIWNFTLVTYV
jgi:hypothetical protein